MKSLILTAILFLFPVSTQAGFPEGENGYDLKKIEESFRLPCDEIGNDDCIARALGVGACTWIFGINKGKEPAEALKIADTVLIALLKGNNLDLKSMLEKDGTIKTKIKKEATYRINFCKVFTCLFWICNPARNHYITSILIFWNFITYRKSSDASN